MGIYLGNQSVPGINVLFERVELPELSNPGTSAELLKGYELLDQDGNIVTGSAEAGTNLPDLSSPASESEVLLDKEYIDESGNKKTGAMPNNGSISKTINLDTTSYAVPSGYTSGGSVSLDSAIPTEIDEQADLIARIKSAVDELPEAGSGGGSGASSVNTCSVTLKGSSLPIQNYYTTCYTDVSGIHCQNREDYSTFSIVLQDVVCGSFITVKTTFPIIPGHSETGGAQFVNFINNGIWVFSIPQTPSGDIVITVREDD